MCVSFQDSSKRLRKVARYASGGMRWFGLEEDSAGGGSSACAHLCEGDRARIEEPWLGTMSSVDVWDISVALGSGSSPWLRSESVLFHDR